MAKSIRTKKADATAKAKSGSERFHAQCSSGKHGQPIYASGSTVEEAIAELEKHGPRQGFAIVVRNNSRVIVAIK